MRRLRKINRVVRMRKRFTILKLAKTKREEQNNMILLLISWINEMVDKGYLEQGLDSLDVVLGISGESDDKYKSKEDGIPLIGTSFQILSDISKREMYLRFKILK